MSEKSKQTLERVGLIPVLRANFSRDGTCAGRCNDGRRSDGG